MTTSKHRTLALVIVAFAFVMDLLDATIVNVAIPSIQSSLHASADAVQWTIAGYALTFALLLITGGRMGDGYGYKKMFLIGVSGFTAASLLSGIAADTMMLVVSRLLQGAAAALMVPQVMSLMQVLYKPAERVKVMGLFGMLGGLAGALGPVAGGLLIQANISGLEWRPIFLINVPIGLSIFILAVKYLPEAKSKHKIQLDILGTLLVMVALGLMIFPLIEGRQLGWPAWTYAMLATSAPTFVAFALYELRRAKRHTAGLIVPSLFQKRTFVSGLALNLTLQAAMVSFFFAFTYTLQAGFGFDPLKAALANLPTAIGIGASITIVSQMLIPKLGRRTISLGSALLGFGFAITAGVMSYGGANLQVWHLIPGLLLTGLGMGSVMAPMFSVALQDVEVEHAGSASGILNAVQQVGGALGIALIGIVFFGSLSHQTTGLHVAQFSTAYTQGMLLSLALIGVIILISFALPKKFKVIEETF